MGFLKMLRAVRDQAVDKLHRWLLLAAARDLERQLQGMVTKMKKCGPGLSLKGPTRISGLESMEVGYNVHIGENAFIRAEGGLVIGDNTRISRNLVLYTVNHLYHGDLLPFGNGSERRPVVIGKNVWIGMNVCIAPGTTIGDGAIVAMGTTVSGEVPPLAIVGSQKWRVLGSRDRDHYSRLEEAAAYGDIFGKPLPWTNGERLNVNGPACSTESITD